jgi:hypothetical protein
MESLKKHLKANIPVREVEAQIHDPIFAQRTASVLIKSLEQRSAGVQQ